MEFVLIPAGTFMMGSPDSDTEARDDEKPAHRVTISQPFYLGKYPVCQRYAETALRWPG
jgi:formylglycine-generating enzyme required for sulfatase activity